MLEMLKKKLEKEQTTNYWTEEEEVKISHRIEVIREIIQEVEEKEIEDAEIEYKDWVIRNGLDREKF